MRRKSMAQATIGRGRGSLVRARERVGDASACEVAAGHACAGSVDRWQGFNRAVGRLSAKLFMRLFTKKQPPHVDSGSSGRGTGGEHNWCLNPLQKNKECYLSREPLVLR
jgi:hypothetical protein